MACRQSSCMHPCCRPACSAASSSSTLCKRKAHSNLSWLTSRTHQHTQPVARCGLPCNSILWFRVASTTGWRSWVHTLHPMGILFYPDIAGSYSESSLRQAAINVIQQGVKPTVLKGLSDNATHALSFLFFIFMPLMEHIMIKNRGN